MQDIGFGLTRFVLADILEAGRRAVVAVRDDHLVFDDQRPDLAAHAVGVFRPDACHAQVAHVELVLFLFLVTHRRSVFAVINLCRDSSCIFCRCRRDRDRCGRLFSRHARASASVFRPVPPVPQPACAKPATY